MSDAPAVTGEWRKNQAAEGQPKVEAKVEPKAEAKVEDKVPVTPAFLTGLPPNAMEQIGCIVFGNQLDRKFWTEEAQQKGYVVVDRGEFAQVHRDKNKKAAEAKPAAPEAKKAEYKKPA
jgi:hypothetical protein